MRSIVFCLVLFFGFAESRVFAQERQPGPEPQVEEATNEQVAQKVVSDSIPNFCLISVYGTNNSIQPVLPRANSGAFSLKGVFRSGACWIHNNTKHKSALMIYLGGNATADLYRVRSTTGQIWRFKINRQEDPSYFDHVVWIDPPGGDDEFEVFCYGLKID